MVRVYGQLFEDGRDGRLAIKPSRPFFGIERDEVFYPIVAGKIDIELAPTPFGIYYNAAFIKEGDYRDPVYTQQWRVPPTGEIDITPGAQNKKLPDSGSKGNHAEVSNRLLTADLAAALQRNEELQIRINEMREQNDHLSQRVRDIERTAEVAMENRDRELEELRTAAAPPEKTVFLRVPVLPGPLQERISHLEAENQRLMNLNDTYYKSVLELNQLKLDRAQTVNLPQTVEEMPDSPRTRLIQKLRAN